MNTCFTHKIAWLYEYILYKNTCFIRKTACTCYTCYAKIHVLHVKWHGSMNKCLPLIYVVYDFNFMLNKANIKALVFSPYTEIKSAT